MKTWQGGNIRKVWELRADQGAALSDNTLSGGASVMGNLDSQDDVIFPGAYAGALDRFRREGFVAVGHDWDDLPIAMPTLAEERGRVLYTEARFHATQAAQDARTVCRERLDAGLSVGLSVGFFCGKDSGQWFEDGEKLLSFASANGYDLSLFDQAGIAAFDDWVRAIVRVDRLVEYSVVTIPANPLAQAMGAKSLEGPPLLRTVRDLERHLRDAGYSRSDAAETIHHLKASLRDAAPPEVPVDPAPPAGEPQADEGATARRNALAVRHLSLCGAAPTRALRPAEASR